MKRTEFDKWARERLLFLDGATGSNLMKRGMPSGVCPETWILEHKDIFIGLQKEYVEAGSNIIYAPTFTANRLKLAEYGLEKEVRRLNKELIALSKEASGGYAYVAADITMTGQQLSPMGRLDFEELVSVYKEQIGAAAEAGADLLVVETMMSLQETRAALIAAKETCELPVMVTLTFETDGKTLYGTDAVTAAITLEKLGACAIGANCSTGPDKMKRLIQSMAEAVEIPVIAKPNAGLPALNAQGETVYDMTEADFVKGMEELSRAGASILGGCCGTSPSYIREMTAVFRGREAQTAEECFKKRKEMRSLLQKDKVPLHYLTSERAVKAFGGALPFRVIGERINPTGKKKLQEELRSGSLETVLLFAQQQEECGADFLDINVGMSGIDEKETMRRVLEEVSLSSKLPLVLDSSNTEVMEAALRRYPGRALINSVSAEKEKAEKLLPLAKKYGAMFILLPLSDKGLPKNQEEKIAIIEQLTEKAFALGLNKEDIVVDGLVTTIGANPSAAKEVLQTISYCRKKGYATVCGLSNISFGLPERSFVNAAFLAMAIKEGLTMAIANPSSELLMSIAFASDLLTDKEDAPLRYIERMEEYKERKSAEETAAFKAAFHSAENKKGADSQKADGKSGTVSQARGKSGTDNREKGQLYQDVLKGNRAQIKEHTMKMVEENKVSPAQILDTMLMPAINEVGELFDKGKYFLPQLIASAEAMQLSIEYLEPLLLKEKKEGKEMPCVVIATVSGDIHDIGKNLVAMMFKNYGFRVIDLGKDVAKEVIVETAIKENAAIIALSALMTTTMQEMKRVVAYARERNVTAKIMIGGAVITKEYAEEIGADGYSGDAADAVRVAKKLLGFS